MNKSVKSVPANAKEEDTAFSFAEMSGLGRVRKGRGNTALMITELHIGPGCVEATYHHQGGTKFSHGTFTVHTNPELGAKIDEIVSLVEREFWQLRRS